MSRWLVSAQGVAVAAGVIAGERVPGRQLGAPGPRAAPVQAAFGDRSQEVRAGPVHARRPVPRASVDVRPRRARVRAAGWRERGLSRTGPGLVRPRVDQRRVARRRRRVTEPRREVAGPSRQAGRATARVRAAAVGAVTRGGQVQAPTSVLGRRAPLERAVVAAPAGGVGRREEGRARPRDGGSRRLPVPAAGGECGRASAAPATAMDRSATATAACPSSAGAGSLAGRQLG